MPSQGPNLPGTASQPSPAIGPTWTNVNNILASDNSRAYVALVAPEVANWLRATNFGFAGITGEITGIQARIERQGSAGLAIDDGKVQMTKNGIIGVGTDKSNAEIWVNTDISQSYGTGTTDLWDATWTPDEIMASTFGLIIAPRNQVGASEEARVDSITITVHYTSAEGRRKRQTQAPLIGFRQPSDW